MWFLVLIILERPSDAAPFFFLIGGVNSDHHRDKNKNWTIAEFLFILFPQYLYKLPGLTISNQTIIIKGNIAAVQWRYLAFL